jgi:alkanesulfonate monooxygenase SsuD/methylene tetrahydromethanopterin reductase-like flavin-dependent oxidoreductase (luciferase family)
MRFGLTILPEYPWTEAAPMWRAADELGFDHAWTYDHIMWGGLPDSPWFAAMPTLTAAALVTERIGLGTFVASPNYRHPVPFMREILALDDISGGRFLLGIGTGGDVDAKILGEDLPLKERVDRFHEFAALLDRVLSEDEVSADGQWYSARNVRTLPGPVRGGTGPHRVPLIVAANGPKSIRLAAERGDGWMTYGGKAETDAEWWAIIARLSRTLDAALDEKGRGRHTVARYLSLDSAPSFSLASVGAFEDAVGRASELGFTDVITHRPRPEEPYAGELATLEAVASDVLPRWR